MGEANQRRHIASHLLVPDGRLVNAAGVPLSAATAAQSAAVKHYALVLIEGDRVLERRALHDPFVRVQLVVKGWRKAWAVLRGRYTVEVQVVGDEQAHRDVFGSSALIRP